MIPSFPQEETALHLAAMNGDLAMCALLLARGANVTWLWLMGDIHILSIIMT
jgi:ankyrin repeat protein